MATKIQAEKTPVRKAVITQRATIIVLVVFILHAAVLAALATITPAPLHRPEPPKPIAVRFVQATPPKPTERPQPEKPKDLPQKPLAPKEVKVIKTPSKPVTPPKPAIQPKPVLSTTTVSKQKQQVILPTVTTEETKSKIVTDPQVTTPVKSEPEAKPDTEPKPSTSPAPILVEGVAYIKPPRLNITERDLKGQARTIKLKVNIGTNGKVEAVQIVSSSGINALDQKVANAVKKATFTPHRVNGIAVPVYIIQPLELNLPH